jgi:RNA-binding protein
LHPEQRKELRTRSHHLKPVVITGNAGITPAVLKEIGIALDHHELIKVRVNAADKEQRGEMTKMICSELEATLIQAIGHIITIYRPAPKPTSTR